MLEAYNLTYRTPKKISIFEDISIYIEPGEIVGLHGKSGIGKTTLAKILSGYIKPHTGKVTIDGSPLPKKGKQPVQLIQQHPEKSINPRWKMNKLIKEAGNITKDELISFGIKDMWLTRFPGELSGGELQRFNLLRAFSTHPKYMIADEITTMLDAITQADIWQLILDRAKHENIGMLVISHDQDLLGEVCDRVIDFDKYIN